MVSICGESSEEFFLLSASFLSLYLSLSLRGSAVRSLWTLIASLRFDVVISLTEYLTAAGKKELV